MYEHQTNLSETKAEHMVALKLAQDDHNSQENELIKDKKNMRSIEKEKELARMNEIRAIKLVSIKNKKIPTFRYFLYAFSNVKIILFFRNKQRRLAT